MYMCVYIYIYTYRVCVYIYIYIYIYILHIYIYIYTHLFLSLSIYIYIYIYTYALGEVTTPFRSSRTQGIPQILTPPCEELLEPATEGAGFKALGDSNNTVRWYR